MSCEIVEMLRRCAENDCIKCKFRKNLECSKILTLLAADYIDQMAAENQSLTERLDENIGAAKMWERRYEELRAKLPRWRSAEEELPEPGTRVLATDGVFVGEAYRTSAGTWSRYGGMDMRDCLGSVVTHWMPLPGTEI